ncbi:PH, RCC1 and FYVE domains-containing protein 1 [Ziziphus jujuba]|uniref:PH, RCC1 and FYVE domains-containing protein 1 n=1 Tax=Ziziphus jujuba TaxID=326968 RepID=A0A6P3ZWG7_ZIZJJ|nr:PH, RCC1 and FYVE domains-containing protein 1 [Ziziphus jujuba]
MADEESSATLPFDRAVQQAIISVKKGAYLLKCRQSGKPKFCPFRLSADEKFLIWYSGQNERQLRLSSVTKIIPGQKTVSFQRQLQPEKESQSFSLVYANGERSLDLICKDRVQADSWILGLRVVISRCHHPRPFNSWRGCRGVQSCVNSPAGVIRRKCNLGLLEDGSEFSQVRSLCGSPTLSLSERCLSDGLSYSCNSFYSSESALSAMRNVMDMSIPNSPYIEPDHLKKRVPSYVDEEYKKNMPHRLTAPTFGSPQIEKRDILKDVMIWGERIEESVEIAGNISVNHNGVHVDALLPTLLESTMMLDIQNISIGGKHAALVTKQGEVFCWGEANGGKLGHKINMNMNCPKLIDSLHGVQVKSVACSEYQTCALTYSGELYTWGGTSSGATLMGAEQNRSQWLPCKLSGPLDGVIISNVACGEWHIAMVSTSGQLFTYGDGTFGVLGHGNLQSVSHLKEVESLKGLRVKSVACGSWHTAAIVEIMVDCFKYNAVGGKLFTWGDGDKGRLGHTDHDKKLLPTCVAQLVEHDFIQVCCGRMLTVGLTKQGTVYTMGSVVHGQLGNRQAKDKSITLVEGKLKEEFVKEIASGSYHVAVLTASGGVYSWGKGANGQLGLGDTEDRNSPTLVEALRDRQVESIICGSNSTAAICLHKSISVSDQSTCSGCKLPFGFTRKKHNCYNCGLLFCHACSSKKAARASLAPSQSKSFRVCDPCFNNLQEKAHLGGLVNLEGHDMKQLTEQKVLPEEKESKGAITPKYGQIFSVKQSSNKESQLNGKTTMKEQVETQQNLGSVPLLSGLPRWGQVQCPALFKVHCKADSVAHGHQSRCKLSSVAPSHSDSNLSIAADAEKSMPSSDEMLIQEVQRLRAEAASLDRKCQIESQKIQECQQKIEDTWAIAREEAAKCKAAKEVIKALALRLHKMSENVSAGREARDGVNTNVPQAAPVHVDTPALASVRRRLVAKDLSPEVKMLNDKKVVGVSNSPVMFSSTLKFLYGRDACHDSGKSEQDSNVSRTESQEKETKSSKFEWVEQYEPGVYITFTKLSNGQKALKRVRFSRKKFSEKEAQRWWEENQVLMYQKYDIEAYENSTP